MSEENFNVNLDSQGRTKKMNLQMLVAFLLTLLVGIYVICMFHPCRNGGKCFFYFDSWTNRDPVQLWLFYMLILLLLCVFAGRAITTFWWGLLIDQRNKISLSRLQLLMWTILLLSGMLVAVLINTCLSKENPLAGAAMDQQLWLLMGISGTSLAGSGLIKTTKGNQPKNKDAEKKYFAAMADTVTSPNKIDPNTLDAAPVPETANKADIQGVRVDNRSAKDASWLDLFMGEETGNGAWLDLGKMQMFLFTLIVWASYAAVLSNALTKALVEDAGMKGLPTLGPEMIGLLAISHGAYLANKAVPQTPTADKSDS